MKTTNHILSILLFLFASTVLAQAEDSIVNKSVTVEREYKPVIQDAGKINSMPKVLDPTVEKVEPNYSNFNLPLNADYNIHTLPAATLQREKKQDAKDGFLRIGVGNYYNTLADFTYPIIKQPDMQFDVSLNHLATFGKKIHSKTKGLFLFDKQFDKFDIYLGQGGAHEYLKYYGDNFNGNSGDVVDLVSLSKLHGTSIFTEKQMTGISSTSRVTDLTSIVKDSLNTFWRFETFAGIRSQSSDDGWRYQAEVRYKLFDTKHKLADHLIHTQAGISNQMSDDRMGMDVDLFNSIYHADNVLLPNFQDTYSVLSLNPYYSIQRPEWNLRLGAKSSFAFKHGKAFCPSADVRGEWKVIPKSMSVYGGVTGSYVVNTLYDVFAENRYLFSDVRVDNTYTPFNFYAGVLVKPVYNLLLDAYVDYRYIDNQYFFVNQEYKLKSTYTAIPLADSVVYTNRFAVIYSGASLLKIGLRASYNILNRVNIELKGAYNGWDVSSQLYAWNKPKWAADLTTDVHVTDNFSVSANAFFEGERYAKLGDRALRMSPKVDINLGATYSLHKSFSTFLKVNNLINNQYQEFYGYDVQGFNVLLGGAFSF